MMRDFSIIVAADVKRGIGKNGTLPWHVPGDLKYFKELTTRADSPTTKNVVIMGRKTWESIPEKFRPLAGRLNIVLSRNSELVLPAGVMRQGSLDEALETLSKDPLNATTGSIFVIGGGQVYREALSHPQCRYIYLTTIFSDFKCDVFLPPFPSDFKEIRVCDVASSPAGDYRFYRYQRVV